MKTYLIDLDGTMYHGNQMNPHADELIAYFIETKQPFYFMSNNSRRTAQQNVEQMERVGIKGTKGEQFFTSAIAAAMHFAKHSDLRNVYCIGEDGLREALLNYGFKLVEKDVDYVFVGLDINAAYQELSKPLNFLLNGAKLVGTNIDRKMPSDNGFILGNGSMVAMYEYASNQKSEPMGKPYQAYLDAALTFCHCQKEDIIILGDNLETDIALGTNNQVETILYTGGVNSRADIERLNIHPDHVIDNLLELIK